jgi:hypothetical protein
MLFYLTAFFFKKINAKRYQNNLVRMFGSVYTNDRRGDQKDNIKHATLNHSRMQTQESKVDLVLDEKKHRGAAVLVRSLVCLPKKAHICALSQSE